MRNARGVAHERHDENHLWNEVRALEYDLANAWWMTRRERIQVEKRVRVLWETLTSAKQNDT